MLKVQKQNGLPWGGINEADAAGKARSGIGGLPNNVPLSQFNVRQAKKRREGCER